MADINQEDIEIIQRALGYEKSIDEDVYTLGWRWYDISAHTARINKLVVKQLVRISFKSNSETRYQLTDMGKSLAETAEAAPEEAIATGATLVQVPIAVGDMFADIVGYDDVKELLRESLQLDKPIHVLLIGPPSLPKSMFLWDI